MIYEVHEGETRMVSYYLIVGLVIVVGFFIMLMRSLTQTDALGIWFAAAGLLVGVALTVISWWETRQKRALMRQRRSEFEDQVADRHVVLLTEDQS